MSSWIRARGSSGTDRGSPFQMWPFTQTVTSPDADADHDDQGAGDQERPPGAEESNASGT